MALRALGRGLPKTFESCALAILSAGGRKSVLASLSAGASENGVFSPPRRLPVLRGFSRVGWSAHKHMHAPAHKFRTCQSMGRAFGSCVISPPRPLSVLRGSPGETRAHTNVCMAIGFVARGPSDHHVPGAVLHFLAGAPSDHNPLQAISIRFVARGPSDHNLLAF